MNSGLVRSGPYCSHLTRTGCGDNVLFLHGSGPGATGMSNWTLASHSLSDDFDMLIPELVGDGGSSHPSPPPKGMRRWMRLWIDQILSLLDELQIQRTHLVGNSLGGAIALHLLMEAPERFDRVVLMGPVGAPCQLTPELDRIWGFYDDPTPKSMRNNMRWFAFDDTAIGDRIDEVAETRLAAALEPAVRNSFEALFPAPRQQHLDELVVPPSALRRITHPTLIIHGRDDSVVPFETSLYLLRHLSNADLHVVSRCNHWTQIEQAEKFHTLLRIFLGSSKRPI